MNDQKIRLQTIAPTTSAAITVPVQSEWMWSAWSEAPSGAPKEHAPRRVAAARATAPRRTLVSTGGEPTPSGWFHSVVIELASPERLGDEPEQLAEHRRG